MGEGFFNNTFRDIFGRYRKHWSPPRNYDPVDDGGGDGVLMYVFTTEKQRKGGANVCSTVCVFSCSCGLFSSRLREREREAAAVLLLPDSAQVTP